MFSCFNVIDFCSLLFSFIFLGLIFHFSIYWNGSIDGWVFPSSLLFALISSQHTCTVSPKFWYNQFLIFIQYTVSTHGLFRRVFLFPSVQRFFCFLSFHFLLINNCWFTLWFHCDQRTHYRFNYFKCSEIFQWPCIKPTFSFWCFGACGLPNSGEMAPPRAGEFLETADNSSVMCTFHEPLTNPKPSPTPATSSLRLSLARPVPPCPHNPPLSSSPQARPQLSHQNISHWPTLSQAVTCPPQDHRPGPAWTSIQHLQLLLFFFGVKYIYFLSDFQDLSFTWLEE